MDSPKQVVTLRLPIKPVPKKRPRICRNGYTFNPSCDDEKAYRYAAEIGLVALKRPKLPMDGEPIHLEIIFAFKRKKTSREHHIIRPDLDNLIKMIDAWNGVLWTDDCQIVSIHAEKKYDDADYIEITIKY